ncbi:MAG: porin family protein, partial [Rhodomicrobium sp.]|nr:porin family protein [Rhodomicrobium sp.]
TGFTKKDGLAFKASQDLDFFGTVRGRIGYTFDRALVYFTGGFAYGKVSNNAFLTNGVASATLHGTDAQKGYALGGGVEYKINPAWSLKGEYQYINFGDQSISGSVVPPNGVTIHTSDIDNSFHTVRVGLNYHVGSSYEPLK